MTGGRGDYLTPGWRGERGVSGGRHAASLVSWVMSGITAGVFGGSRIPGNGEAVTVPVCLAVAAAPNTARNLAFGDVRGGCVDLTFRKKGIMGERNNQALGVLIPLHIHATPYQSRRCLFYFAST